MSEQANPLATLSTCLTELAERSGTSVVGVRSHGRLVASGFAWKADVVVTASDALEADDDLSLILADGSIVAAELAGRDPTTDIAVLRLKDTALQPPAASASTRVRVGQLVLALGRGMEGSIASLGMVAMAAGPWQSMRGGSIDSLLRIDMRLDPRAEGGLVVDADGRHVGMPVFGPRRRTLVIPMATIERVAPKLLAEGRIRRGYLGLGLQPIRLDEALAQANGLPGRRGIMVISLDPSGPARAGGVHVGDIIVGVDGEAVAGMRGLHARLTPESVGKAAVLKVVRAGQVATANVTIGASPTP
jgi:S1-C subfamily serine protease